MSIRFVFFVGLVVLVSTCREGIDEPVQQMSFDELQPLLQMDNDTVFVINFWATWCKPCIEELPEFERLNHDYQGKNLKVILVSLDFPGKYEEVLLPWLQENKIRSQVIHLTDVNANAWINLVDPDWSGAIPATLIYKGADRSFFESKMSYDELKSNVELKL